MLHDFAKLLAKGRGEDEEESEAGIQLLYGHLVRQNPATFKELVTSNKKVLQKLLWLGPEESSAFLHSNALTYRSMEHLKRTLLDLLGIKIFPCLGSIVKQDKATVEFVNQENFNVFKLQLYRTASSPVTSECGAIQVADLASYLSKVATKTLSKQKDGSTRNLRHPIYGGRLLAIIESDKGGHSMKHAIRFGPNNLVVLGAYKASDIHANCVTFLAPWIPQLQALMAEGLLVWREAGEEDMPELEEGRVYEELEDLRPRIPLPPPTPVVTATSLPCKLLVKFVGDQEKGVNILLDTTDLNMPLDNVPMVVVEGEKGDQDGGGGGEEQSGGAGEEDSVARKVGMGEEQKKDGEYVVVPVDVVHAGDMAGAYTFLGLSGASSRTPSPYTTVPSSHLAVPHLHNWEQPDCMFPYRTSESLIKNWVACSRDTRNGGSTVKNAKNHGGSKASPILPFPPGHKDFLGCLAPFLLHLDLGICGKFLIDHMAIVCRIHDKLAVEEELQLLTDLLAEEVPEQEGEERKEGEEELETPILMEQRRQAAEVAVAAAEQQLAVASLEQERELLMTQETYKEVVQAAAQGPAGREVLLELSKKTGAPYLHKRFLASCRKLSCAPHCLLTGKLDGVLLAGFVCYG